MKQKLIDEFDIPNDWEISQGETREKEGINQSTEITIFTVTSPDGEDIKTYQLTVFTNHKGTKDSWREIT